MSGVAPVEEDLVGGVEETSYVVIDEQGLM